MQYAMMTMCQQPLVVHQLCYRYITLDVVIRNTARNDASYVLLHAATGYSTILQLHKRQEEGPSSSVRLQLSQLRNSPPGRALPPLEIEVMYVRTC